MDNLSLPSFSKKSVIPCFVRKRDVTQSFASLSNFIPRFDGTRNNKHHSPHCRNTEHQMFIPRFVGTRNINAIPRFVGTQNINFHSPLCRNTEYQCSFPVCRRTKCQKCHPQCVWSRDVTDQNVCFYKPSVYKYIPNFPIQLSTR